MIGRLTNRGERPESAGRRTFKGGGRRRSVVLAVATALTLVLVAASVFTVGERSRTVVRDAADLQAISEVIRSATLTRSQLAQANVLVNVDRRFGTDSGPAITSALTDSRRGLAGVTAVVESVQPGSPLLAPEVATTVARFVQDGDAALASLGRNRSTNAELRVLAGSFERARVSLVGERDRLLGRIETENRTLSRLGTLATFLVAFVVPAVAALIYLSLTRRPRSVVQREITDALRGSRRRRRIEATRQGISEVREAILAQGATLDSEACSRLDDLAGLIGVIDAHAGHRFRPVDVDSVVRSMLDDGIVAASDVTLEPTRARAWTDPRLFRELMSWLIRDLTLRDATALVVTGGPVGEDVRLRIAFEGAPLGDDVTGAFSPGALQVTDASPRLTAAILLADSLGVEISVPRSGSRCIDITVAGAPGSRRGRPARI